MKWQQNVNLMFHLFECLTFLSHNRQYFKQDQMFVFQICQKKPMFFFLYVYECKGVSILLSYSSVSYNDIILHFNISTFEYVS